MYICHRCEVSRIAKVAQQPHLWAHTFPLFFHVFVGELEHNPLVSEGASDAEPCTISCKVARCQAAASWGDWRGLLLHTSMFAQAPAASARAATVASWRPGASSNCWNSWNEPLRYFGIVSENLGIWRKSGRERGAKVSSGLIAMTTGERWP